MTIQIKENTEHKNHFKETRTELLNALKSLKTNEKSIEEIQKKIHTVVDCFDEETLIYTLLQFCNRLSKRDRVSNGKKLHYKDIHNEKILYRKSRYSYKKKLIYL